MTTKEEISDPMPGVPRVPLELSSEQRAAMAALVLARLTDSDPMSDAGKFLLCLGQIGWRLTDEPPPFPERER
jgi:hypothetical protein